MLIFHRIEKNCFRGELKQKREENFLKKKLKIKIVHLMRNSTKKVHEEV